MKLNNLRAMLITSFNIRIVERIVVGIYPTITTQVYADRVPHRSTVMVGIHLLGELQVKHTLTRRLGLPGTHNCAKSLERH